MLYIRLKRLKTIDTVACKKNKVKHNKAA